jgi:glycosyltransferase involved in cell wall biosynthesis
LSPPSSLPQAERDTTGMPGLTVVVLTYNSAATIGACLDALVRQEYKDFDVVVVDDDSTDETLSITSGYSANLRLSVTKNGSHNIPRGRNIGIDYSYTELVAFVDSDDLAADDWTRVMVETFREHPDTALIVGDLVPAYRTSVAHAIALNDDAVRQLFGSGLIMFGVGNSAINRKVLPDVRFNEDFRFAEDLEFVAQVNEHYAWRYVPGMKIHHYSRETFAQYAKQMYQSGYTKMHFSFAARSYRWLDFVPIALLVGGGMAGLVLRSWWLLLGNLPFALAEALFVVCYQRCTARIAALTFPAWVVKNLCWSYGLIHGLVTLTLDGDVRRLLRSKRAVRT